MNQVCVLFITILLGLAHTAIAVAEAPFVSKTFREIQGRVTTRDAKTGAILAVKAKEDAPGLFSDLKFSITKSTVGDQAEIVLSRNWKTGDEVYEKYLLRLDAALRQELQNQQRLKISLARQENEFREKQTKKIATLTGGRLRFGMWLDEVEAIKGKPLKSISGGAAFGAFTWVYPDLSLRFVGGLLRDVEQAQNEQE